MGTFRFVCVFLMETLAAWTPTTAEMEIKILFGRHLWLLAQSADALGRRAHELRAKLHYSRPPRAPFLATLDQLRQLDGAADRVGGFYDVALDQVLAATTAYRSGSDALVDEPSFVLLDELDGRIARMRRERDQLLAEIDFKASPGLAVTQLRCAFAQAGDLTEYSAPLEDAV